MQELHESLIKLYTAEKICFSTVNSILIQLIANNTYTEALHRKARNCLSYYQIDFKLER